MDYMEIYDNLGTRLLNAIDVLNSMEKGLRKKANESIKMNGGADGTAGKYKLRIEIKRAEIDAITNAIKVIQPLAQVQKNLKEQEAKNKQLEQLIKQMEEETDGCSEEGTGILKE